MVGCIKTRKLLGLGFERMLDFRDLELLGLLLGTGLLVLLSLRLFKVMQKANCPQCDGRLTRKKRNAGDYVVTAATLGVLPFKRYKCLQCGWEGLRWRKDIKVNKGPRP